MSSRFDTTELVKQGEKLRTDVYNFAQELSAASRTAIDETNPHLTDTEVGEEWPLTFGFTIEQRLEALAIPPTRSLAHLAISREHPVNVTSIPQVFMSGKFRNRELKDAYGAEAFRERFACDVLGWIKKMEEAGWPLLARMCINDLDRVKIDLFEDNESAQRYFATLVSGDNLTEEDTSEGAEPYCQLSDRVLVDDKDFAASVLSSMK